MEESQENMCGDCEHFFPDREGPTASGICLLDPELEPYEDEILEFNFQNCASLVRKKCFDINHVACSQFSPAEISNEVELDDEDGEILMAMVKEDQDGEDSALTETNFMQKKLARISVEPYQKNLYSPKPKEQEQAVTSLIGLMHMGNEMAQRAMLDFMKSFNPPQTLEEVHFKIRILEGFRGVGHHPELMEILLYDLENTASNNTTRQWLTAILDFLRTAPPELAQERLETMLSKKIFSQRFQKRVQETLERMRENHGRTTISWD